MQALTKAEEEIMRYVWELGECSVGTIRDAIAAKHPNDVPAQSTVSTVLKHLRDKKFIGHRAFGRTFIYHPLVTQEEYSSRKLKGIVSRFFGGSAKRMVSFLVEENGLSLKELNELTQHLNDGESSEQKEK
ncbi:MAG: BlaI/MecI/CopY family transcriptional regulator [Bacteroidota bacterium]